MMVEDRGSLGLTELQQPPTKCAAGNAQPSLRGLATLQPSSPQLYLDINRTKAESLQVPLVNVFDTLQPIWALRCQPSTNSTRCSRFIFRPTANTALSLGI